MKILHTSDWHLGRILHGHSLVEDQQHVLEQILVELEKNYDVLIVAGDVFDRAVAPAPAMTLLNDFLNKVRALEISVVMIPGNHDSMERLNYGAALFEQHDIHIRCSYDQLKPVAVKNAAGDECDIFTMPFVEHHRVGEILNDETVLDKESAIKALLTKMKKYRRSAVPSILVAHEFIDHAEESESERVFVGGSHLVNASLFNDFSYVALGHLHKAQEAGLKHIHYCGTPLAYSFGEVENSQGVLSVSISGSGVAVEPVLISPFRPMVVLEGAFETLVNDSEYDRFTGHYVSARITDEGHHLNLQARLRERFPHLLETRLMAVEKRIESGAEMTGSGSDNPMEVFDAFLKFFQWSEEEEREEAVRLFEQASEATRQKEAVQ